MNCREVPARLWMLHAGNGDPLLLYGHDTDGYMMVWPTRYICHHPIAFGRWCRKTVGQFQGMRVILNHEMPENVDRWATWLGVRIEEGVAVA